MQVGEHGLDDLAPGLLTCLEALPDPGDKWPGLFVRAEADVVTDREAVVVLALG